jgi:uncharacterized protein YnzC (UPF0291/DUF896 family)
VQTKEDEILEDKKISLRCPSCASGYIPNASINVLCKVCRKPPSERFLEEAEAFEQDFKRKVERLMEKSATTKLVDKEVHGILNDLETLENKYLDPMNYKFREYIRKVEVICDSTGNHGFRALQMIYKLLPRYEFWLKGQETPTFGWILTNIAVWAGHEESMKYDERALSLMSRFYPEEDLQPLIVRYNSARSRTYDPDAPWDPEY